MALTAVVIAIVSAPMTIDRRMNEVKRTKEK
jgi:hypothetical protein